MREGFRVLIIDDDRHSCRELAEAVERRGFAVQCVTHGDNPVGLIRELHPDVVVLDISPTEDRGLDTLRRLETSRTLQKVPIIVLSRQADLEYELLDAFDFLPKPVDRERLLEDLDLLVRNPSRSATAPYPPLAEEERLRFQDYLIRHSGLHFEERNLKTLERGLMRRMRALRSVGYREYFQYLEKFAERRQELKKLLGLLTIGETYFFRYLAQFEGLWQKVLPELILRNRDSRTLRLWSAGCSTGEEPYTMAILLEEHFPELRDWDVRILGTDINHRALKKAREGFYRPRALRITEPHYLRRYFRPVGSGYELAPHLRKQVRFDYLNLQTGAYPAAENGTAEVDLIFCRNVMIYFRLSTIRQIVERFTRCLCPGGYLFLGHAETLTNISDRFRRVTWTGGFFYRLGAEPGEAAEPERPVFDPSLAPARPAVPALPPELPKRAVPVPPAPPAPDPEEAFQEAREAFFREDFSVAAGKYDIVLRHSPRHVGALVGKGFILANRGDYHGALEYCARALQVDDLTADAYFLSGLIRELEENWAAAAAEYRKALLLDLDFIMPHYHLSRVYRRLTKMRDALRELVNTMRLLEKTAEEAIIPLSGGLSREVFLEVCREELSRVQRSER